MTMNNYHKECIKRLAYLPYAYLLKSQTRMPRVERKANISNDIAIVFLLFSYYKASQTDRKFLKGINN